MKILIGLLMTAIGMLLIIKTEWFIANFGLSAWAEEKLGNSGGTRLLIKLIGIFLIFFGFMLMTGLMGGFLQATVVKLFIR